jgi:hypothetical protein
VSRLLACLENGPFASQSISIIPLNSSPASEITSIVTPEAASSVSWSPDGRTLALATSLNHRAGAVAYDAAKTTLTDCHKVIASYEAQDTWEGRRIAMPIRTFDPHLRAGWEQDTPVEDSLLRAFLVNWTLSIEAQGKPFNARTLRRDDLAAVDVGHPSVGGNVATLLAPLVAEDVDEVLAELDNFYCFASREKSGAAYLFSAWPTPDLRPHGWSLVDYQPLMLRPVGGDLLSFPPGLRIEEARNEEGIRAFETVIVDGFPIAELAGQGPGAAFKVEMLEDERQRLWVGWEAGQPVSAASAFVAAGVNNVTLVATLPEARGRGYGAALTWRATLADPTLPAMLLATDDGRPIYERLGYLSLFRFTIWARNRLGGTSQKNP